MVPKEVTVLGRLQRARDDARARDGGRSRLSDPVPRRVGPRGASGRVGAHHHAAWIRFATIGDPERGFVQFGTETWCYVRRAPHAGFALAGPRERAGLVIDHMEQVLLAAEESRSRQEGPALDRGRGDGPSIHAEIASGPRAPGAGSPGDRRRCAGPGARASDADPLDPPESPDQPPPLPGPEPDRIDEPVGEDAVAERPADPFAELIGDVDRFSLAREFGRLLQGGEDPTDG
jgi:hypothetical protein